MWRAGDEVNETAGWQEAIRAKCILTTQNRETREKIIERTGWRHEAEPRARNIQGQQEICKDIWTSGDSGDIRRYQETSGGSRRYQQMSADVSRCQQQQITDTRISRI